MSIGSNKQQDPMSADKQISIDQYIALRETQKDLDGKVNLLDQRQKDLKDEQNKLIGILEQIRNNMATKDDIRNREKTVDTLENDLKGHVKETNIRLEEMSKSNQTNILTIQASVNTALENFKTQVFTKFDSQADKAGKSMVNTAFLTGKFSLVYAIIVVLISSVLGGVVSLIFTHAK